MPIIPTKKGFRIPNVRGLFKSRGKAQEVLTAIKSSQSSRAAGFPYFVQFQVPFERLGDAINLAQAHEGIVSGHIRSGTRPPHRRTKLTLRFKSKENRTAFKDEMRQMVAEAYTV